MFLPVDGVPFHMNCTILCVWSHRGSLAGVQFPLLSLVTSHLDDRPEVAGKTA